MTTEIAGLISSAKVAVNVAKSIQGMDQQAKINEAVIQIQQALIEVQQVALDMSTVIEEQRAEIEKLRQFDLDRFDLKTIETPGNTWPGTKAYLKQNTEDEWYCPVCFSKRQLVLLQFNGEKNRVFRCTVCTHEVGNSSEEVEKAQRALSRLNKGEGSSYVI